MLEIDIHTRLGTYTDTIEPSEFDLACKFHLVVVGVECGVHRDERQSDPVKSGMKIW